MPTGPGDVLDLIRRGRATTRGDVLEATGLSRMTVAQRVDALLAAGLVVEEGTEPGSGGRRPKRLVFNSQQSRVAAVTVETSHTRVAVTDLDGRILAEDDVDVSVGDGPERTLDAIENATQRLLADAGVPVGMLCGIGVSVPGPVDPRTRRPSQPPIMPGWDGYPVVDHLQSRFPVPVVVANDADAAALGEQASGHPDERALCLVKVSTGIGTGIVVDGRVYTGADGGAGDIGHVRLSRAGDALCQCGSRGCLASVASGRAVAQHLTAAGIPARSGRDVRRLLNAGDPDAARLTQEAGRLVGEVLATVVCLLNPGTLVIAGDLASAPLIAGIRESLYPRSLPRATRNLVMQLAALGNDAALFGLTRMVVDQEFAAAAVNARLGSGA